MLDKGTLSNLERDALREVANIGAGHAATALSQMTGRRIMISVPEVSVRRLEEVALLVGPPDTVIAGVLMHVMGDLTGRTLVVLGQDSAHALCELLLRKPSQGPTFDAMQQSTIKETGNILFLDGHVSWRGFKEMKCWLVSPSQWF